MNAPSCGGCRFFKRINAAADFFPGDGECRRYAPGADGSGSRLRAWQHLNADEWCGEFTPNGEAPRIELRPGTTLAQLFHDYVHVCEHGYIGATCGLCLRSASS